METIYTGVTFVALSPFDSSDSISNETFCPSFNVL